MKYVIVLASAVLLFPIVALAQTVHSPTDTGQGVSPNGGSPLANTAFVTMAGVGGLAEVQAGQLATDKAASPTVRDFGRQMVADHTMVNQQLMQLAARKGLAPPTQLDPDHLAAQKELTAASGTNFDKQYVTGQITDHRNQIMLFQQEASGGQDTELKELARMTLPTLQHHLEMAQSLAAQMK